MLDQNNSDLDLVPEYLQNWKDYEVKYDPNAPLDTGDEILFYKRDNGKKEPIAARGELLVITGPQKSRKSLMTACMMMSNYSSDENLTLNYMFDLAKDEYMVYFDTEQPKGRTRANLNKVHKFVGEHSHIKTLHFYNIKKLSPLEKIMFVTHILQKLMVKYGKPPAFLAVDQLADLCIGRDVNNDQAVDHVYKSLCLWQDMTAEQTLIAVVVHTNRGRQNTNGKLGVMLDQKCDCQFLVDINADSMDSTVTHKEARRRRVPAFDFRQDFDGRPRFIGVSNGTVI